MDQPTPANCPPHHWDVTMERREEGLHYHHRCRACGQEKSVPANGGTSVWRKKGAGRPAVAR